MTFDRVAYMRAYRQVNAEKWKEYNRESYKRRSEQRKTDLRTAATRSHHKQRKEAMDRLGGKCVRCGFKDARALQFNHINGGGMAERKARSNYTIIHEVADGFRNDIELLCANCNQIHAVENGLAGRKA